MKTNSNSTRVSIKKSFLMMAICLMGVMSASAFSSHDPLEKDPTVTSVGIVSGELIFNVKYDNAAGDKLEVVLTDRDGSRLYRQIFTDKNLVKTFRVPADIQTVYVRVTNLTSKNEQKFEVSAMQRTIEEV